MSVVSGVYGAYKSAEATTDAAELAAETSQKQYDQTRADFAPYSGLGQQGIDELNAWDSGALPSWEETVSKPMEDWKYEKSTGYDAQLKQDLAALNSAQNARGLSSSGVAATQAAGVATDLTAQDYANEYNRAYGAKSDLYAGSLGEYQQAYGQIMDKINTGLGGTTQTATAGQSNAQTQAESATAAGEAEAGLYSGLGGLTGDAYSTYLQASKNSGSESSSGGNKNSPYDKSTVWTEPSK